MSNGGVAHITHSVRFSDGCMQIPSMSPPCEACQGFLPALLYSSQSQETCIKNQYSRRNHKLEHNNKTVLTLVLRYSFMQSLTRYIISLTDTLTTNCSSVCSYGDRTRNTVNSELTCSNDIFQSHGCTAREFSLCMQTNRFNTSLAS